MAADFSMTAELLAAHRISTSVSEIHGVLSGQICADSAAFDLGLSIKILEIPEDTKQVITKLLKMLAEDILSQLETENYAFELLLPDADEEFSQRLIALSQWCNGFNAGFAGAWVRDDSAMETDTREVLSDFSRIAEVDEEDEEASESDNEVNFMEIEEYVRMAAITVFLQNNANQSPPVTLDINVPDENIH
ncbi:MAG: UPF0149 family protein [Gammaproteobacteria bacterium]|nr:UPF0149 family protein [Gammaproteobacteria bacterium]